MRWSVVVPVKRLEWAKSRLRATLAAAEADPERATAARPASPAVRAEHRTLVLAMVLDTVAGALACPTVDQVLAVTDDVRAVAALRRLGAVCVADTPDAGLNPALAHGAVEALRRAPGHGVAVLAGDLPALRPAELAEALAAAAAAVAGRAYVADVAGSGTTLLAAARGTPLAPEYGAGSAAAHAASGARTLTGHWASLRQDVDTADDLARAIGLGVGPHVAALLPTPAPGPRAATGAGVPGSS